jgi:hypothetical protein
MQKETSIQLFENRKVRTQWDADAEKWYISIVDVIEVLTESANPRKYGSVLKTRLKQEGSQLATNCSQLKINKLLLIFFLAIGFADIAKADTIDFWHVYYNGIKIKEFNQYSKGEVSLKLKDIKKTDYLTILYFRDTPCEDCETKVEVEKTQIINGQKLIVAKGTGVGTFKPIKIFLSSAFEPIIMDMQQDVFYSESFFVYYSEEGFEEKVLLFKLKLEQ